MLQVKILSNLYSVGAIKVDLIEFEGNVHVKVFEVFFSLHGAVIQRHAAEPVDLYTLHTSLRCDPPLLDWNVHGTHLFVHFYRVDLGSIASRGKFKS